MTTRTLVASVVAAGTIVAVTEWIASEPADIPAQRVADGVVGFVILAAAAVAWHRRRTGAIGLILAVAGGAWLAGALWSGLAHLHRGPLVHLHVSYPSGRLRWWPVAATVGAAYVVATVEPLGRNDTVTIGLSIVVVVVALGQFARTTGTARRAGLPALFAAWTFAGVLGIAAFGRRAAWHADTQLLWAYYIAIAVAITVLLVDFVRAHWANAVVTDLVIDLGRQPATGALRATIGRALGDPRLVLAYPLDGGYVDDAGRPIDVSDPGPGRAATEITRDGTRRAVLLHDTAVLDDPALVESVAAAAGLAVTNARMQASARERVAALVASRQRLVEAGETQRRRFGQELHDTVETRLARIADMVVELQGCSELPTEPLDELLAGLHATRGELRDVAAGLLPRALTDAGLASALHDLAARTAGSVDVAVGCGRLSQPVEATVYYVCAEGLSNVAKHASATHVRVTVTVDEGTVSAVIEDDGSGGADEEFGSGLRGLADRVEATGGCLTVISRPGSGTRLVASVPQIAGTQ